MGVLQFVVRLIFRGRLTALQWLGKAFPEAGPIRIGTKKGLLLGTPELIEKVLVHHVDDFQKSPALRIHSRPLLGNGLLTSEGEEHRAHRRLVAPAFAHQRIPQYAGVMFDLARKTCDGWADGAMVDMHREMTRLTLGIVGRTLFDIDLLEDADQIGKHITELIEYATKQTRSLRPTSYDSDTRKNRRATESVAKLDETILGLIERRRRLGLDKGDFLSMLLLARDEEGNGLSDQQVRDEAMTLFVAGHETTANGMTWALYLLGLHPEIQQRLREEVRDVVGNREIVVEDLRRLAFAMQVFKEALRLYPPAYIVVREAVRDVRLNEKVHVREGDLVALSEYVVHRNGRYFQEPLRFDPDRFTPENESKIPRYAYFPFGAGRRICIGSQFALMEGQIILATIMQKAQVILPRSTRLEGNPLLTLRPRGKALMEIRHN